jgi:pimeloyl-ACP methyl ester carboxylesterase
LDNAASYDRLAPLLPDSLQLVALDWSGHGLSSHRPPGVPYHFVDWIPELLDAADALGWETFSLMGHSMGAGASVLAAGAVPERIEKLVLLEGLGPFSSSAEDAPEQMLRALSQRHMRSGRSPRVYKTFEEAVRQRMNGFPLEKESARLLTKRGTRTVEPEGYVFRYAPALRNTSLLRLSEEQVCAFLSSIRCPVLVVQAMDGLSNPAVDVSRRLNAIRDFEMVQVEGGHHVHLDHPERIAEAVAEFLLTDEPDDRVDLFGMPENPSSQVPKSGDEWHKAD